MSDDSLITPVILSGGSGTRLWPLSTSEYPKQFLNLIGPTSLFQQTLERCNDPETFNAPIIVSGEKHLDLVAEQLNEVNCTQSKLILEPCGRNTAPAIALAALACKSPQDVMLVMPSDHMISNVPAFHKAVRQSISIANARWLVTFGIEAASPETGYGYIEQGEPIVGSEASFSAKQFVEKPNQQNAEKMLDQGGFYWNAGIFLFRADTYLEALSEHAPEILTAAKSSMESNNPSDSVIRPDPVAFEKSPSDSIDYAVMEPVKKVAVTPVNPGWSDVGSWDALFEAYGSKQDENVAIGKVNAVESKNVFVHADGIEVSTYGLEDMIIVANQEQILVIPKGQSQNVKRILEERDKEN